MNNLRLGRAEQTQIAPPGDLRSLERILSRFHRAPRRAVWQNEPKLHPRGLRVALTNGRWTHTPSPPRIRRGEWFGRTNPNCASGPPTVARTRTLPLPPCRRGERFGRTNPNCRPRPSGLQVALTNLARTQDRKSTRLNSSHLGIS